jgi:hypothetical protein
MNMIEVKPIQVTPFAKGLSRADKKGLHRMLVDSSKYGQVLRMKLGQTLRALSA